MSVVGPGSVVFNPYVIRGAGGHDGKITPKQVERGSTGLQRELG
jgi:hypothetical protein